MGTTSGLLCALLSALLPYCLANIDALIVDDFSATPKNTSFSAVRFILGQPKKKDIQLMVRMHWEFEKSLAFKKALVVLFERFEVPSYGDLCPNVMVNLQKDTDPPESVLEIQGSCLSHDLAKEWFTEDANLVTLQIQGLSPASTSQADSLRLLLLAVLLPLEGAPCPPGTLCCPNLLGSFAQPVCLHSALNDSNLAGDCQLVYAASPGERIPGSSELSPSSSEPTHLSLAWINIIQISLYVGLVLGFSAILIALFLWRNGSKGSRGSSSRRQKVSVSTSHAKPPGPSNGFAPVGTVRTTGHANNPGIHLPSFVFPQQSNGGPPTSYAESYGEIAPGHTVVNGPFLDGTANASESTAETAPLLEQVSFSQNKVSDGCASVEAEKTTIPANSTGIIFPSLVRTPFGRCLWPSLHVSH
uniref:Uncharacterized protein n=1 Tax=Schistocephalus solidus TaxID=70667 RepID=A0A0X3P6H5_SCHSO